MPEETPGGLSGPDPGRFASRRPNISGAGLPGVRPRRDTASPGQAEKPGKGRQAGRFGRELARETAKGAAQGSAAAGVGAAAGAAKGAAKVAAKTVLRSKKGRMAVAGIALYVSLPIILIVATVFAGTSALIGVTSQAQNQAAQTADANVPLTGAEQQSFLGAQAATTIPWEIPAAVYYYETGPGKGLLDLPGTCPDTSGVSGASAGGTSGTSGSGASGTSGNTGTSGGGTVSLGCPPLAEGGVSSSTGVSGTTGSSPSGTAGLTALVRTTKTGKPVKHTKTTTPKSTTTTIPATTTTTRPPIVYLGPMQIRRRVANAAPGSDPSNLTWSATWVSQQVESFLQSDLTWESDYNLADGVVFYPEGPPMMSVNSTSAKIVQSAYTAALAAIPVKGMSQTGAQNIFELAQDWFVASAPQSGNSGSCGILTSSGGGGGGVTGSPSGSQQQMIKLIVGIGKTLNIPQRGWAVAIDTALDESGLNPNPGSLGGAYGLFQQTPPSWGTQQQVLTPSMAAEAFYGAKPVGMTSNSGLMEVPGWQTLPLWAAAQDVQHSGSGQSSGGQSNYGQFVTEATADAAAAAGDPAVALPLPASVTMTSSGGTTGTGNSGNPVLASAVGCGTLPPLPGGEVGAVIKAAESQLGVPYEEATPAPAPPGTANLLAGCTNPTVDANGCQYHLDCSALTQYAFQTGANIAIGRTTANQWATLASDPHFKLNMNDLQQLKPGDLLYGYFGEGEPANIPGHVYMYIGQGKIIQEPQPGGVAQIIPVYDAGTIVIDPFGSNSSSGSSGTSGTTTKG